MSISRNLKILREKYKLTQQELADIAGVSNKAVSTWEKGTKEPRMGAIQKIADHFDLKKSHLIEDGGLEQLSFYNKIPDNMTPVTSELVSVPIIGEIACGDPILAEENIIGYGYELKETLPSGEVFLLIAKGDSMQPTIPNGAKVLIRSQADVESGEIAAVLVNGDTEATLKRVKKQNGSIILVPDNPAHDAMVITEDFPAKIIGKAMRFTNDL